MQPSYGELMNMSMFWYYIIGICFIIASTCAVIYLWYALSRDRQITRDIIGNVNETTVVFDSQEKPCYISIAADRGNIIRFLHRIDEMIDKSGLIPENFRETCLDENTLNIFEGEIIPYSQDNTVFSWKMCPIVRKKKYMGRIFVFNDITQYKKLYEQLDNQNQQLKAALEAQRQYARIARRLAAEEEHERIMGIVNGIARDYLKQLNKSIKTMEKYSAGNAQEDMSVFETENDRMIRITRETIDEIRRTVKVLHVSV